MNESTIEIGGQTTIPAEIIESFGLKSGDRIAWSLDPHQKIRAIVGRPLEESLSSKMMKEGLQRLCGREQLK